MHMSEAREEQPTVAYFSMEVGLEPAMPTYSGGLGVLAGDTLRAAADLAIPLVGVTLLYRKGYFHQYLDSQGNQNEGPVEWSPEKFLEPMHPHVTVTIEGREVRVRAWRYFVIGVSGYVLPVYFLDTGLPENSPWDQGLTDSLYGGDAHYRLCQEVILGFGGVAMLRALGYRRVQTYHMNEGHSALLTVALLNEWTGDASTLIQESVNAVRRRCVFTTHTPVEAGHDKFPLGLVKQVLGEEWTASLESSECCLNGSLNMTYLALFFSHYINGVAMRHGEISRNMFPHYPINSITNGVHSLTWAAVPFRRLFDTEIPEWRHDNLYLRYAISISLEKIREAHLEAKRELLAEVKRRSGIHLNPEAFTIGFARRAAEYKRGDLLFSQPERLMEIARNVGPLQIIYAGKAHPHDENGKNIIRRIFQASVALVDAVPVVYLADHGMELAKTLCAGVDLWLNTPQKPHEASGTSGMKAAMNGVPSLSVLDGWWVEGHAEGVTGWSIGESSEEEINPHHEANSLYEKLEWVILPMFYKQPAEFARVMRSTIALNASFFNSQRMMFQYLKNAYQAPRYAATGGIGATAQEVQFPMLIHAH